MKNALQTVKQKLVLSVVAVSAMLISPAVFANNIMLRVDGMYCYLCLGGLVGQIKQVSGVAKVDVWLKDGILAITPSGQVDMSRVKSIIQQSGYTYVNAYSCMQKTANLASCKSI
jgi:copper chaperone CopZ